MKYSHWKIPNHPIAVPAELEAAAGSKLLAALLVRRGLSDPCAAACFLRAGAELLEDPMLLPDMEAAVRRIDRALAAGERMAVYGDYDVDGISSACLLTEYLRSRGARCELYIPDRLEEGYGLNTAAIEALYRRGVTLIVTVDCGVTAVEETAFASSLGVDMVITDHHECLNALPAAVAVVDPKRTDGGPYPGRALAGVGVAFKLVCALSGNPMKTLDACCDLLSLGTVADVMPLLGENRFLISLGLSQLAAGRCRPGLTALLAESDTADKPPTAATLSFRLAPRINAAGRLGQADTAVRLLLTRDPAEAMELARVLCRKNRERQELETEIWIQAQRSLSGEPPELPIVLAGDGWHEGVIGIAASRLVDAFHLPAVMICLDGERGKGSCRSLGGFNLFEALSACSDCLEGFGGHAMAAGLTIRRDRIDELRQRLGDYYLSHRTEDEAALELDLAVDEPGLLSEESVRSLEKLEPCGNGNPQPLLYLDAAELTSVTPIGGGKHLRLTVRKFGCSYTCLFFSRRPDELGAEPGQWVDLAFTPQINEFRGLRSLQLVLTDLRLHDGAALCDRLLADGAALAGEVAAFLPDRGDFARLWRRLAVLGGQFRGGLHELAACFGCEEERVCICLAVLRDLSLISVTRAGEMIYVDQSLPAEKADLEKSELLRRLRGL